MTTVKQRSQELYPLFETKDSPLTEKDKQFLEWIAREEQTFLAGGKNKFSRAFFGTSEGVTGTREFYGRTRNEALNEGWASVTCESGLTEDIICILFNACRQRTAVLATADFLGLVAMFAVVGVYRTTYPGDVITALPTAEFIWNKPNLPKTHDTTIESIAFAAEAAGISMVINEESGDAGDIEAADTDEEQSSVSSTGGLLESDEGGSEAGED